MKSEMTSTPDRLHYGWVILGMCTLAVFAALGLGRFSYTVLLPPMQAALRINNTQAGIIATADLIGYLIMAVLSGALAARYGARTVIAAGLGLAGVGMLLVGQAGSFITVAIWRVLIGIGSGASNVPAMGLVAGWFAARRRGLALGIAVMGISLSLIVMGPLVPSILTAYGERGWRISWFLFGGATLGLALGCLLLLRNRPGDLGLSPLFSHIKAGNERVAVNSEAPSNPPAEPLQWGRVYRSTVIWHLGLVYTAFGFSYVIYTTFFTKYLIAEGGYSLASAGALFMALGWFSLPCGLIWGTISDVIGRKWALVMVYLLHTIAFSLFSLWPASPGFILSALLFGLTAWSIPTIMAATCGDVLGPRLAPAALGFITLFFGLGQALGPSIAGALADAAGSFTPTFLLAGGVALLGAAGAALLRPASPVQVISPA